MDWKAENIQYVVFPSDNAQPDAFDLFIKLTGSQPDTMQPEPGTSGRRVSKRINSHDLTLVTRPGRIDLVITPSASLEAGPVFIDDLAMALQENAKLVYGLIDEFSVTRVSCVAHLVTVFESPDEALEAFIRFTSAHVRPGSTDLVFSSNQRKEFEDFTLNRIDRFATKSVQSMNLELSGSGLQVSTAKVYPLLQLVADYNTVPQPNEMVPQIAKTAMETILQAIQRTVEGL